ncbi:ABC transporter ATP-binding protein [bacterium AH-315-M05]|nr:ABC transporter ATP-binding protein [bacterium AH-315-M05]
MAVTGKVFDISLLKRVLWFAMPYKETLYLGLFLTILLAFLAPLRPWLIQYAFDNYISTSDAKGLLHIIILMIGLLLLESVVQFYNTYLTNWLGQSVIKDLRLSVYKHITQFKLKYFDNTAIGTIVTRVVSDIETIAEIFSQGLLVIMGDLLQLVVIVGVMFYIDWRLALISLTSIPLLLIATNIFKRAIKSAFQDVRTQVARLNAFVQEHITGMNILQIFNREEVEMEKFKAINKVHTKAHLKSVWSFSIFLPVVEILSAISLGLLIWWGAKGVIEGQVTIGNLIAFILYIYMLFRPIRQLADRFNTLQMGMVSSERVFKILDTDEVINNEGTISLQNISGQIEFKNVWFAYNNEDWVLKDVSFSVDKGKTAAIVGATGAGKTSIINILSRFYEINKGSIKIDGIDTKDFTLEALRKNIAVVLQDVFLFSDTIFNNITLNNKEITREQVIKAAKNVGVHEFIEKLPSGYDYNVRERGIVLSVGQRQLIAFLRAYVFNPRILVLDEATSSVDTESEILIQQALKKLTENRTSIIIAHRLATVQAADKILVMDHGKIIETGNHQELLKLMGITVPG